MFGITTKPFKKKLKHMYIIRLLMIVSSLQIQKIILLTCTYQVKSKVDSLSNELPLSSAIQS